MHARARTMLLLAPFKGSKQIEHSGISGTCDDGANDGAADVEAPPALPAPRALASAAAKVMARLCSRSVVGRDVGGGGGGVDSARDAEMARARASSSSKPAFSV